MVSQQSRCSKSYSLRTVQRTSHTCRYGGSPALGMLNRRAEWSCTVTEADQSRCQQVQTSLAITYKCLFTSQSDGSSVMVGRCNAYDHGAGLLNANKYAQCIGTGSL